MIPSYTSLVNPCCLLVGTKATLSQSNIFFLVIIASCFTLSQGNKFFTAHCPFDPTMTFAYLSLRNIYHPPPCPNNCNFTVTSCTNNPSIHSCTPTAPLAARSDPPPPSTCLSPPPILHCGSACHLRDLLSPQLRNIYSSPHFKSQLKHVLIWIRFDMNILSDTNDHFLYYHLIIFIVLIFIVFLMHILGIC